MPTLEDRKFELRQKRSDALMAKINVLRARDGSVAPPIPSMKEEDLFNLGLLFGSSRSENIAWAAMGIEGLIRCYYEIVYKLKGVVRNNIIKLGATSGDPSTSHNTSSRSGLTSTVKLLQDGQGYRSGFYVGWDGIDVEVNDTSNRTRKQRLNDALSRGRKGEFDVPMTDGWTTLATQLGVGNTSSSFTSNRDKIEKYNSVTQRVELVYPDDNRADSLLGKFDTLLTVIGQESPMGPHTRSVPYGSVPVPYSNYVHNSLLGKRFTDISPSKYTPPSSHTTGGGGEDGEGGEEIFTDGTIKFGNGVYDFEDVDVALSIINTNLANKYIIVQTKDSTKYCIWFRQDGIGTQPTVTGAQYTQINVTTNETGWFADNDSPADVAGRIYDVFEDLIDVTKSGSSVIFNSSIDLLDLTNCVGSSSQSQTLPSPPSGYSWQFDYWDPTVETACNNIVSKINDIINYIGFTKIVNFTYLVNSKVVPGIDPNYNPNNPGSNIGASWNLQNGWIAQLESIKTQISDFVVFVSQNKESSVKTKSNVRNLINDKLQQIKSSISVWTSSCASLGDTVNGVFGDVTNPLSLYGHRFLWIRTLIHPSEGTMTSVGATDMAIDVMNKKLKKSEDELLMFGIMEEEFIPIPVIVGIEPYPVLNQTTFEMEIGGWLVAWGGQEHCTGYDVWRSFDYDPATKNGTWSKIEASNTQYTMSDINANNGKVLTYIIDTNVPHISNDVDPSTVTHPYYKVKAYDYNGGSGDYARKNSASTVCEPLNPAAFPLQSQNGNVGGPRRSPVTVTEAGPAIPPNTLFWVTNFIGSEATDFERRTFISEAPFDSIASNLIVFVDGKFKNKGLAEANGDYNVVDTTTIKFHDSIPLNSEVNLVVALRSFASKNKNLKGAVDYYADLATITEKSDGDIYKVEIDPADTYWQWNEANQTWNQTSNPDFSNSWKEPVNTYTQLPSTLNSDGDIRLVLDTSIMFRWNADKSLWAKVSGSTGSGWLAPVDTTDDLDEIETAGVSNGAIVYVIEEESLYRWSTTQTQWLKVVGSGSANWKNPVNNNSQLPLSGNSEGDIRLVLTENKIYRWFAWDQKWEPVHAEADMAHTQLNDEDWNIVDDHDARYYPKSELDTLHNQFEERFRILESLKPKNAEPLSGDFAITGTKVYEGYLSVGESILRYDTLRPGDYFRRIIKDANFIMSNTNTQQFKDADKGKLYCFINNVKVDEFDLASWFDESKRESGQTYPRQFGINNVIEILSVGPYNQYSSYQRADFQLNIREDLLLQGENKIQLKHEVGNITNDINKTDEFIIFWDAFDGAMGFKEIYLEQVELNSNKYLSGIRYYSLGDKLKLRFKAENLFNNTYVKDEQIRVGVDDFGITGKYVNYEDSHVLGTPIARIGEDVYYLEDMTINQSGVYNVVPSLRLEATNPFKTFKQTKNNTNLLINTVDYRATDKEEVFVDEKYRLPLGSYTSIPTQITGVWNSQIALTNSDLQVYDGKLIYPQENFSKYKPTQTTNYSTMTGMKQYCRAFKDTRPHNNGKFIITNFVTSDPNIKVEIKLPGKTGWLNLGKLYNVATFSGIDGDGCLISNSGESYNWTSGGFSTADSGYMIIMRITFYAKTNYISVIKLDW